MPKTIRMAIPNPYNYDIILASGSPRRQQFLTDLGIPFRAAWLPLMLFGSLALYLLNYAKR